MADQKITDLTPLSGAVVGTDLLEMVDDPGGTPLSRKVTFEEAKTFFTALQAIPADDHSVSGPNTNVINAGATIAIGELCYLGAGGKWLLADADAAATATGMLGISVEASTDTNPMITALSGSFVRDDTYAWTVGAVLYVGLTAGTLTETAPSATGDIVRVAGYAVSADVVYFNPSSSWVEIA